MKFRKAYYSVPDKSRIDMELEHPVEGWIPITISQEDYPEIWAQAVASKPTFSDNLAEEYHASQAISKRQRTSIDRPAFCIALRNLGVIDQQWAVHAAQGNLPVSLYEAILDGGIKITQEDASVIWAGMASVPRTHQFVEAVRKAKNLTPVQMDELFT